MSTLNKDIIKKILELIHSESKKSKHSIKEVKGDLEGQISSLSSLTSGLIKYNGTKTASQINSASTTYNFVYLVTEEFVAGTKFHSNYQNKTFPAYTWVVALGGYYNGKLYVLTSDNDSSVEEFSMEEINTMIAEIFEEE